MFSKRVLSSLEALSPNAHLTSHMIEQRNFSQDKLIELEVNGPMERQKEKRKEGKKKRKKKLRGNKTLIDE